MDQGPRADKEHWLSANQSEAVFIRCARHPAVNHGDPIFFSASIRSSIAVWGPGVGGGGN